VDAKLLAEQDVKFKCLDAGLVLGRMENAGNGLNIIILDACRNNPYARSFRSSAEGLARMDAPTGSIIAYATAPDSVAADGEGRNGVYTEKLLKNIREPGLPVEQVFKRVRDGVMRETKDKQVPWESTSLRGDFYFSGGPGAGVPQPASTQLASVASTPKPAPAELPKVAEPAQADVDFGDIKAEEAAKAKADAESRKKWASWQAKMRSAVAEAEKLEKGKGLSAQQKAEAWLRVASAYTQKNPYSDEDDALRAKINARADYWSAEATKEAERQAKTEAARIEAEHKQKELAAQKAKAAEEARLAAERQKQELAEKAEKIEVSMAGRPSGSPGQTWREPVTGMEFVWVPKGCFQMGCNEPHGALSDDQMPVHEVCVSGFWLGKYEVTQGQWQKVMGSNPSSFKKGDNFPVEKVSWDDAKAFIAKLNGMGSARFKLPTEAEWEYACRSGGRAEKYAGGDDLARVAWHSRNSGDSTHKVGTKAPNGLGLYDMSGNVGEWVEDVYGTYPSRSQNNPVVTGGGSHRVSRGGSWYNPAVSARCSHRGLSSSDLRFKSEGFRLARIP
jgi:formylglycine-generating enzyme required for sulfatase activity